MEVNGVRLAARLLYFYELLQASVFLSPDCVDFLSDVDAAVAWSLNPSLPLRTELLSAA